ncbi:MAG: glutamine amidotransferase [Anaerolineae bacterium]
MSNSLSILFVGESCFATSTEYKGIDQFAETNYYESAQIMIKLLGELGHKVTHIPCHLVSRNYPRDIESLMQYDVVLFSDVGTNTFLLLPEVCRQGKRMPNLLTLTKEYVSRGGGFGMIGGYMTFQGMEGKGKWKGSCIEEILPVDLLWGDDRWEVPEGADLCCTPDSHPILAGMPAEWPYILGYNKLVAKPTAQVLVAFHGDPIIAVAGHGQGRTLAYATDCTPHWAPQAMYTWEHYAHLWNNIVTWLAGK